MINPNKKREPSPMAHLGLPQICGRYRDSGPDVPLPVPPVPEKVIRLEAARALISEGAILEESSEPEAAIPAPKRGRGRPALEGKPWDAEGISRSAWYAKKKSS